MVGKNVFERKQASHYEMKEIPQADGFPINASDACTPCHPVCHRKWEIEDAAYLQEENFHSGRADFNIGQDALRNKNEEDTDNCHYPCAYHQ